MRKKISLGAAVAAVLLCCLATFQLTYLLSRASFEKKYLSEALDAVHAGAQNGSANAGSQTAGETVLPDAESASFLEKVNAKLSEVDSIFRSYYINDIDDDFLADCVLDGYIAGTKDAYGAYYNAAEFEDFMNDLGGELVMRPAVELSFDLCAAVAAGDDDLVVPELQSSSAVGTFVFNKLNAHKFSSIFLFYPHIFPINFL